MINLLEELKSRPGPLPEFALRLWFVALALLVVFAAMVLNAAQPLRLVDPRWLQGLIGVLLSQGFLPLIALVLLPLAVVINPKSSRLRRRRDRFSRLALVAALGFALLIPLQLASTWGNLNQQTSGQNQQRLQGLAVIGQLRQAISTATSHQDLASPDPNQPERDPLLKETLENQAHPRENTRVSAGADWAHGRQAAWIWRLRTVHRQEAHQAGAIPGRDGEGGAVESAD